MNKLTKPPNYDLPEIRGDDKSMVSANVKNQQLDDTFNVKPLDDFTSVLNVVEPSKRGKGGFWLLEKDILQSFEYIQVSYDPAKYATNQSLGIAQNADNEIATYDHVEIVIVQRDPEQDENATVPFLLAFQPKQFKQPSMNPFTVLQRFDFESYESIKDYKLLDGLINAQMLLLDNKNNIFRLQTYSPLAYQLWLSSSSQIQTLSVFDYLTTYESYASKPFTLDYPAVLQHSYFNFFRFHILIQDGPKDYGSFLFRLKSTVDNSIFKSFRLKLIESPSDDSFMLNTLEGVHKNLYETTYIVQGTQRIQIRKNVSYYLLLEGLASYTFPEGAIEIEFLYNPDYTFLFEQQEQVEPLQYFDRFVPSKYGIIFREKLFVGGNTFASFYLKLGEVANLPQQTQQTEKKQGKNPKQPEVVDVQETELKERRLLKLELIKNEQVVLYNCGYNHAVLSYAPLSQDNSYILQATFDLRDWPEAKDLSPDTELIHWFLTVFSTETVAVVRDTTKEDREKAIKKSWEDNEPGRAEKAKKSRAKFFLKGKQDLTEEEQALLNQPRVSRKQREEEAKQQQQAKGGKAAKKDDKKGKAGKKEEVPVVQEVQQRPFPKSSSHVTEDIVHFLKHLESDRIVEQYAKHAGLINVRSDQ